MFVIIIRDYSVVRDVLRRLEIFKPGPNHFEFVNQGNHGKLSYHRQENRATNSNIESEVQCR